MDILPKRKTDEQYVEAVRKRIGRSAWFGAFHAFGAAFFLVMFGILWRMISTFESVKGDHSSGVEVGIMLGATGGLFIMLAVQNIIWAAQLIMGQRSEKLLLQFHDELRSEDVAG